MFRQEVQVYANIVGAVQLIAEYTGPYPECQHLKKYLCFTRKCKEPEVFWVLDDEYYEDNPLTNEEFMAFTLYPAQSTAPECETYTFEPLRLDETNAPAGTTLNDILGLIVAADGGSQTYPTFGAVDIATDFVMSLTAVGQKTTDVLLLDGNMQNAFAYNTTAGKNEQFPGQTPFEVPEGCVVTATLCVAKYQDKAGNPTDPSGRPL